MSGNRSGLVFTRRWVVSAAAGTAAGFAALASGCSLVPAPVRPPAPVPASFGAEPSGPSIARIGWEAFFREPQVQALIREALAGNRDIRVAASRVEEARAMFRIAGSALYPQLELNAAGSRSRTPADLSPIRQTMTVTQLNVGIGASWLPDFWGELAARREAAREQYLATEEARRAVVASLIAQVAYAYLAEREYAERSALARQSITTREDALRIMRRRYETGAGSKLEMTQAQMLLAQAQATLQSLDQQRDLNRNALQLLVGHPVTVQPAQFRVADIGTDHLLPAGLPSDLLEYRPDVRAAEHRLRAANADIGAARAAFFPSIVLTGSAGTASSDLDRLFGNGSGTWSFAPSLRLPLFNGGRNRFNLDLAEARRNTAVADYERTIQQAFRDVADALVDRRQLAAQVLTTEQMLAALRERARLAQLRFDNGRSAYLEVLDAQRDLFDTEQMLVQLKRGYLSSSVALYAALGGGVPPAASLPAPEGRNG
jgi:NodT family efflux transporter outer membrane factor (OMF) lipoprotein